MPSKGSPLNFPGGMDFAQNILDEWKKVLRTRRPGEVQRNGQKYKIVPEIVIGDFPLIDEAREWLYENVLAHTDEYNQLIVESVYNQFDLNGFLWATGEQMALIAASGRDVIFTNTTMVLPVGGISLIINPKAKNISHVDHWIQPHHQKMLETIPMNPTVISRGKHEQHSTEETD